MHLVPQPRWGYGHGRPRAGCFHTFPDRDGVRSYRSRESERACHEIHSDHSDEAIEYVGSLPVVP